jgi:hypothetical protein
MMSRLSAIAIDGEARYAFFLEKRLGRLSGHLQAEDVAQGS